MAHGQTGEGSRAEWIDAEDLRARRTRPRIWRASNAILRAGRLRRAVGTEGKINGANSSRRRNVCPYLGICLGMQMAGDSRAARNLRRSKGELAGDQSNSTIEGGEKAFHAWWLPPQGDGFRGNAKVKRQGSATTRAARCELGAYDAVHEGGSKVFAVFGLIARFAIEESPPPLAYEVDIKYREALEAQGLCFSGMSPDGRLPEIVEVEGHPWFIGVQFHPELKSKPFAPHPLFRDFVRAAKENSRLV